MSTNDEISATIVNCISGRGGVGKTTISLNLTKFLSSLNEKKVLLIDFDLVTSGATHFFRDEIKERNEKNKETQSKKSIVELLYILERECKPHQQIVKLLDELASDDENRTQYRKDILALLDELVDNRINEIQRINTITSSGAIKTC